MRRLKMCTIANGIETELTFRKKDGGWKLMKLILPADTPHRSNYHQQIRWFPYLHPHDLDNV